jgi:Spy/CpxP family protein refolding chaperone
MDMPPIRMDHGRRNGATMKNATRTLLLGCAIVTLILPAAARAGGPPHGRGHAGARLSHLAEALELTEEQQAQVREIFRKHKDGALGTELVSMREARRRLDALIHDAAASDAQVRQAADEHSTRAARVAVERHRMVVDIDRLLTDEQRDKARELRQQRQERRAQRFHAEETEEIEETDEP